MNLFIKNKSGKKISVCSEVRENQSGLAFVMHGLGGNKDEGHIRTYVQSFLDNGISVVSFDTRNTFGKSEGEYENATTSNYLEDLEDVIEWAKSEKFYEEPFYLVSHSLSGLCTCTYTFNNKEKVKALAPTATVISGELSIQTGQRDITKWKQEGFVIESSDTSPTGYKKLNWTNMEDRLKYDLLGIAPELDMPILMMVGDKDTSTPLKHQKLLFDKLPKGNKEMKVFQGPHFGFTDKQLKEIYGIMDKWIKKTQ